eukprot:TRINITY_DN5566_c0_g1_i1.p1 TRINITY_DN5566_c0_g1~~TRINITY_DN5566_c0_g1_i1.p1  ORF type:complete len:232 (+),score=50.59 TRINITY_DN5566_c0_g1_i1:152-847(+)
MLARHGRSLRRCHQITNEALMEEVRRVMERGGEPARNLQQATRGSRTAMNHEEEFKQMDLDRDGLVSPNEYAAWRNSRSTWINGIPKAKKKVEEAIVDGAESTVSATQLYRLAMLIGVPMVGFGFVDNFLMITFGDVIESSIGVTMALSTMAAAGLGNLCSDVAGLGLSKAIEDSAARIGLKPPNLTAAQSATLQVRLVSLGASVLGVSIGCILGMVPLLFKPDKPKKKDA